jgi:hypothetical protein
MSIAEPGARGTALPLRPQPALRPRRATNRGAPNDMPSVRPRRSSRIAFHPLPANDPRKRKPEISEAIAQLHWHPKTTLEEGLIKTIVYFFDSVLRVGATAHPRVVAA